MWKPAQSVPTWLGAAKHTQQADNSKNKTIKPDLFYYNSCCCWLTVSLNTTTTTTPSEFAIRFFFLLIASVFRCHDSWLLFTLDRLGAQRKRGTPHGISGASSPDCRISLTLWCIGFFEPARWAVSSSINGCLRRFPGCNFVVLGRVRIFKEMHHMERNWD